MGILEDMLKKMSLPLDKVVVEATVNKLETQKKKYEKAETQEQKAPLGSLPFLLSSVLLNYLLSLSREYFIQEKDD